jgi:hypothetical protein
MDLTRFQDRLRLLKDLYGRGSRERLEAIDKALASREAASAFLTHGGINVRLFVTAIIGDKWHLDGDMVDRVIEAIEQSSDEHLLWNLYFLLGRNVDAKNSKRILVYLLSRLQEKAVSNGSKSAIYASIICQSQILRIFHNSTMAYINAFSCNHGDCTAMFDGQFLEKVRRCIGG